MKLRRYTAGVVAASLFSGCAQESPPRNPLPPAVQFLAERPSTTLSVDAEPEVLRVATDEEVIPQMNEIFAERRPLLIAPESAAYTWLLDPTQAEEGFVFVIDNPVLIHAEVGHEARLYVGGVYLTADCAITIYTLRVDQDDPSVKLELFESKTQVSRLQPFTSNGSAYLKTPDEIIVGQVSTLRESMSLATFERLSLADLHNQKNQAQVVAQPC